MDEIWKPITEYEGLYEVSSLGRVRSLDRISIRNNWPARFKGQILKPLAGTNGYLYVNLRRLNQPRHESIHRIVAKHFLPPRQDSQIEINHIDLDKKNNLPSNLEWCTQSENARHAVAHGIRSGMTNPRVRKKLSPELVAAIREGHKSTGITLRALAKQFGISKAMAHMVVRNRAWKPAVTELSVK